MPQERDDRSSGFFSTLTKIGAKRSTIKGLHALSYGFGGTGFFAGIKSIYDFAWQIRRDIEFNNNTLDCPAAYNHQRIEAKISFSLFFMIMLALSIPVMCYLVNRKRVRRCPVNQPNISETSTTRSNQELYENPGTIPQAIGASVVGSLTIGLVLNGIYAAIRYAFECAQPTQDFTDNPQNCIAAFQDLRSDIRTDFTIYWALFGVGLFFSTLYQVDRVVSAHLRNEERATRLIGNEETASLPSNTV